MNVSRLIDLVLHLGIRRDRPDVSAAQLQALGHQIPLLYFILTINSLLFAHAFAEVAPVALTAIVPTVLCIACIIRGFAWYARRERPIGPPDVVVRSLRVTTILAAVLGVLFIS